MSKSPPPPSFSTQEGRGNHIYTAVDISFDVPLFLITQVHKERFRKYTLDDGAVFEPSANDLQTALEGVAVAISATLGAVPRLVTEPRFAHFWASAGGKPAYTQLTALVRDWVRVRVGLV